MNKLRIIIVSAIEIADEINDMKRTKQQFDNIGTKRYQHEYWTPYLVGQSNIGEVCIFGKTGKYQIMVNATNSNDRKQISNIWVRHNTLETLHDVSNAIKQLVIVHDKFAGKNVVLTQDDLNDKIRIMTNQGHDFNIRWSLAS